MEQKLFLTSQETEKGMKMETDILNEIHNYISDIAPMTDEQFSAFSEKMFDLFHCAFTDTERFVLCERMIEAIHLLHQDDTDTHINK